MKHHITTTTVFLNEENIFNDQIRCEYLKYEIRKFSIHFPVSESRKTNKKNLNFRKKKKTFEDNLANNECDEDYLKWKHDLSYIYDQKIEGIRVSN